MCLYLCLKSIFWYLRLTMDYGQSTKEHQKSGWRPPRRGGESSHKHPWNETFLRNVLENIHELVGKKGNMKAIHMFIFLMCIIRMVVSHYVIENITSMSTPRFSWRIPWPRGLKRIKQTLTGCSAWLDPCWKNLKKTETLKMNRNSKFKS